MKSSKNNNYKKLSCKIKFPLKKGQSIYVKPIDFVYNWKDTSIIGIKIDSNKIQISSSKYLSLKNYTIGIIFDLDNFIPRDTYIKLYKKDKEYSSFYLEKKIKVDYPSEKLFKLCKYEDKIFPRKLKAKVYNIDTKKKFIDLVFGKYYNFTDIPPY